MTYEAERIINPRNVRSKNTSKAEKMIKEFSIVLVDDHLLFRSGLRAILGEINNLSLSIAGEAKNGKELLTLLENGINPDLILLDIMLPDTSGVKLAKQIRNKYPKIKILVLSSEVSEEFITEFLNIGVEGYLNKIAQKQDIKDAIWTILNDGEYFGKSVMAIMYDTFLNRKDTEPKPKKTEDNLTNTLSDEEIELIQLMSEHISIKDLAKQLAVSERTIKSYKSKILNKLGFSNTFELIKYAVKTGIIEL